MVPQYVKNTLGDGASTPDYVIVTLSSSASAKASLGTPPYCIDEFPLETPSSHPVLEGS